VTKKVRVEGKINKKKKKRIESKERSMPLIEGGGRIEENLQNKSPSDFKILLVRKNL
jgi:hypothetical protein